MRMGLWLEEKVSPTNKKKIEGIILNNKYFMLHDDDDDDDDDMKEVKK